MKIKRKIWIINKPFQYRFIAFSLIPTAAIALFFLLSIEIIFYLMIEKGKQLGLPLDHAYYSLLLSQKKYFLISTLVSSLFIFIGFSIWSLVMSNQIAGPLYRLSQHLKKLNKDNLHTMNELKFRNGDYFQEIPVEVNELIKRMK
ncbi:MAG: hypothetical protein ACOVP4_06730 [Bacteriovoracaceae bacterium]